MANWYGSARSNYVKVDDKEGITKALEPFDITLNWDERGLCLTVDGASNDGAWPTTAYVKDDEGVEDEIVLSPETHICPYLAEGEVIIFMEIGAEKLRYLTGYAEAYKAKTGEYCVVSLNDIYNKAAEQFGVALESISLAEW